jgi:hypothetical protein
MKSRKQIIKQALILFAVMTGALTLVSVVPTAFAGAISSSDSPDVVQELTGGTGSLRELVLRIVNFFLTFLGILAVIMVIYGGVTYVTAAGNDEAVGNAKNIILYALVGIIIILLSFAIVNTILGAGTASTAVQ